MKKHNFVFLALITLIGQPAFAVGDCTFNEAPISGGNIALQRVASGLTQPIGVVFTPSQLDRFYVIEKPGRIVAVKLGGQLGQVLDIRDRVSLNNPETGLLGLTFHPQFPNDRRMFINYVTKDKLTTRISSFVVGSNGAADPRSEKIIMEFKQPYGNHNGGDVKFGPDGMLYISVGDGGDGGDPHGHAQNLGTVFGSILRIDVNVSNAPYGIPRDNPFVGNKKARPEIWAYGLRNPWRFSFDKQTGTMWAGDVGQDLIEEIDVIKKGGNYGWNIKEGNSCFLNPNCNSQGLIPPIWQYTRENGRSVTGGYVYRGQAIRGLGGQYLYADFYTGKIWGLTADPVSRQVQNKLLLESQLFVSTFGEDAYGELYVADHQRGEVYKIVERAKFGRGLIKSMVPKKLSETGCFKRMNPPMTADKLTKFQVNSPLWTDYAFKERFLSLPVGKKAKFEMNGEWQLPDGATLVKNFYFDLIGSSGVKKQIVETRLLIKTERGYLGFSYAWNANATEAYLLEDKLTRNIEINTPTGPQKIPYLFPSRSQCVACHSPGGFGPLALTTQQTNLTVRQSNGQLINQIHYFVNHGDLDRTGVPTDMNQAPRLPSPGDASVPLELRARSYIHANCSHCHNKVAGTGRGMFDLRWGLSLAQTNLCNATPLTGDIGIPGATIMKAGEPEKSLMYLRSITRNPKYRMPPAGSHLNDPHGTDLIKQWIEQVNCAKRR